MVRRKILLFTGLCFFGLATFVVLVGWHPVLFWTLMCAGVCMKVGFLIDTFRLPDFKMSAGMYMILVGIGLILSSLLFKWMWVMPVLRNILFYSAIMLKVGGVALLFYQVRRSRKRDLL